MPGWRFWLIALLLAATFLMGGSPRADVASLFLLRPAGAIALGIGLAGLRGDHVARHRLLLGLGAAIVALPLLHLAPLPPEWWQSLPGRTAVADIDREAGLGQPWRPLSLDPQLTRNAFFAALVPLAVLVLGVQLDRRERGLLLPLLLACGAISAALAVGQAAGAGDALRFYEVSNFPSAAGLFANRNHQAIFLALVVALLAANAACGRTGSLTLLRSGLCALCALAIVPLVLLTGSRAGLVGLAVALLAVPAILRGAGMNGAGAGKRAPRLTAPWVFSGLAGAAALLVAISVQAGRAVAWDRLWLGSSASELRVALAKPLLDMAMTYLPWGSGVGTFQPVWLMLEQDHHLSPVYMNHAHNDWLEAVQTGGIPALALMVLAGIAFARVLPRLFRANPAPSPALFRARAGAVAVVLLGIGSLGDYPLRTPSLACLFVVAVLWISDALTGPSADTSVRPAT